jgi:hypothetical protein
MKPVSHVKLLPIFGIWQVIIFVSITNVTGEVTLQKVSWAG